MIKNKVNKILRKALCGAVVISMIFSNGQVVHAATNDGGLILSDSILSDPSLVNPNRDYHYRNHGNKKSVLEVKNVDGLFDYVKMESLDVHNYEDTSHLKYIVIHETGTPAEGAVATNVFSYFTKVADSTMFIVDDKTVLQAMEITGKGNSLGTTDPAKSDVFNSNSLSIEICDNVDGDFMRAVANAIYLVRGILEEFPHLELRQHADAWSEREKDQFGNLTGVTFQKDCPRIIRSEATWWTWEKFVYYATNPKEDIPFIDFIPEDAESFNNSSKSSNEGASNVVADVVTDFTIVEEVADNNSFFKENIISKNEALDFNTYLSINVEEAVKDIKNTAEKLQMTDEELTSIVNNLDVACKVEKINPHIMLQLMNGYTGFFSFGGYVQKEDNNFGGLKNKDGKYIKYESIQEGVFAFVQYIKSLTTEDKLILDANTDAIKTIKKKGSVKNVEDLAEALEVEIKFIESTLNRVQKKLNI